MSVRLTTRRPAQGLEGEARVPGDKSISHRAVLFGALAEGTTRVRGFLDGADCRATVEVVRGLGVEVEGEGAERRVHGRGLGGLREPQGVLDARNSGTTLRLVAGVLAGQRFASFVGGTPQLQGRPMGRIVAPLRRMGAQVVGRAQGTRAPLAFAGSELAGIVLEQDVASAQVRSCVTLAGLFAEGETRVRAPGPCRDHTERLLRAMGAPLKVEGAWVGVERPQAPLAPLEVDVPGDPSSAAFVWAAAALVPGSEVCVRGVGINPTRAGVLEVLARFGAEVEVRARRETSGEPVADVVVRHAGLRGVEVGGDEVVRAIDELPVLAVVATQAEGETVVRDAGELRVKETDRIESTAAALRALGAQIETTPDGWVIQGGSPLRGACVSSAGDHRLAMALAVAGLVADGTTTVTEAEVTADSFPGFAEVLRGVGAPVEEVG